MMGYSTNGHNVTAKLTILPVYDSSPCGPNDVIYTDLEAYSLIASAGIIICLSLLEKRSNKDCRCDCQRPSLVFPVNLLDHGCDNFGYSMAFGSVASYCFTLFFDSKGLYDRGPAWSKTLYVMLYVLMYGLMFYPLFACLTTTWVFIGSLLGLGYTALWIFSTLRVVILCPSGSEGGLKGQDIAVQIPVLFCLMCLFLWYGFILIKHLVHVRGTKRSYNKVIQQCEQEHLGTKYNVRYVKDLLVPACRSNVPSTSGPTEELTWHERFRVYLRRYIYTNDSTFKYSPRIICIFTVAFICAYQFGILIILEAYQLSKFVNIFYPNINSNSTSNTTDGNEKEEVLTQIRLFIRVCDGSILVSFCISSLLTLFSIFKILTLYKQNIKRMYKGDFSHLPFKRDSRHPQFIMSNSLAYAGSQIAYTLWGYVVVFVVLLITCLVLMYVIVLPVFNLIPRFLFKYLWNILPGFVILKVLMILQKVFSRLLLQTTISVDKNEKETSAVVLAVDNRKVYHNVSYFLFFFYIVLGVFGCFLTIIKGVILGILYLPRIDKCGLVSGFESWDTGYMYYVSFLHIEECHRHPVLLVFCDILYANVQGMSDSVNSMDSRVDLMHNNGSINNYGSINSDETKCLARNRWFKAYTMIRNPGLKIKDVEDPEMSSKCTQTDTNDIQ